MDSNKVKLDKILCYLAASFLSYRGLWVMHENNIIHIRIGNYAFIRNCPGYCIGCIVCAGGLYSYRIYIGKRESI